MAFLAIPSLYAATEEPSVSPLLHVGVLKFLSNPALYPTALTSSHIRAK
jgi:hypothetical protein